MTEPNRLRSQRLLLRQWQTADRDPFASLNADPEVMAHFPATLSRTESDTLAARCQAELDERGWGVWVLEQRDSGQFIGITGLNPLTDMPFGDGVEVLWRMVQSAWGQGFATEAAQTALDYAFSVLGLEEIVAFATIGNRRSIAVMERLGMENCHCEFRHPALPANSKLSQHVLYRMDRAAFSRRQQQQSVCPEPGLPTPG